MNSDVVYQAVITFTQVDDQIAVSLTVTDAARGSVMEKLAMTLTEFLKYQVERADAP